MTDTRLAAITGMINVDAQRVVSPVDSDRHPVSVLIQGDDVDMSYCDACRRTATDFPGGQFGAYPAAMVGSALYCADCLALCYDPYEGDRVSTLTGS